MIPLGWYLVFAAALFALGLYGALARRNAISILMGIELMLNAAMVNLAAFWRYLAPERISGQVFVVVLFAMAAAEAAVGLALIISIYRSRNTVLPEETDLMKG
jgi:NADH:ubiquinone oxidoreductase subunit K